MPNAHAIVTRRELLRPFRDGGKTLVYRHTGVQSNHGRRPPRLTTRYCKTTATSRTARRRALRPRAVVIKRPRFRLRHRRIERIRRPMRTARRVVPLRRIRTATTSRPRSVRAQVFIPVLRALCISRHRTTKTVTPARAERDSGRRQCKIGLCSTEGVGTTSASPVTRNGRVSGVSNGPRSIGAAYSRRQARSRRMPVIPSRSPTLRPKHWHPPTDRSANRARKHRRQKQKAHDRGGGREAERVIHQRSEAGDMR